MQRLAEICLRRTIFASMLILSLVVVGAVSYFRLGVDRFPSVDLPTVNVRTALPGASPAEVEAQGSQPLEAVSSVLRDLPDETDPPIISKLDNDQSPILSIALSGQRSARDLTELADKVVKVQLERSKDVGEVDARALMN